MFLKRNISLILGGELALSAVHTAAPDAPELHNFGLSRYALRNPKLIQNYFVSLGFFGF